MHLNQIPPRLHLTCHKTKTHTINRYHTCWSKTELFPLQLNPFTNYKNIKTLPTKM